MQADTAILRRCLSVLTTTSGLILLGAQMTPVHAADSAPGVVVRYTGRDLRSDASAQRLLRRVEFAAHDACGDQRVEPLPIHAEAQRCYQTALAHAVGSMNAPRVSAAYVAKYGTQAPADEARAVPGRAQHSHS